MDTCWVIWIKQTMLGSYEPTIEELGGEDNIMHLGELKTSGTFKTFIAVIREITKLDIDYNCFEIRLIKNILNETKIKNNILNNKTDNFLL